MRAGRDKKTGEDDKRQKKATLFSLYNYHWNKLLSMTQKYLEFLPKKGTGVNILYIHSLYISNQFWHVILLMLTQVRRNLSPPCPSLDFCNS